MREYTLPPAAGIPDGKIKAYLAITEKETYGFYLYEEIGPETQKCFRL